MKTHPLRVFFTVLAVGLLCPAPAWAMHIADGILPLDWAAGWFIVAGPCVTWGLWRLRALRASDPSAGTLVAMVGAAVFVISCMPVPIPWVGSCSHPCGTGLAALLIGAGPTIVVAAIALLFQALFLAHGGLTTWGANVMSMGVVGAVSAVLVFRLGVRCRVPVVAAAFLAGAISDWATYATTSLQLASALHDGDSFWAMFGAVAIAFVPTQLPLGFAEGILTVTAYRFIRSHRPELLAAQSASRLLLRDHA